LKSKSETNLTMLKAYLHICPISH